MLWTGQPQRSKLSRYTSGSHKVTACFHLSDGGQKMSGGELLYCAGAWLEHSGVRLAALWLPAAGLQLPDTQNQTAFAAVLAQHCSAPARADPT